MRAISVLCVFLALGLGAEARRHYHHTRDDSARRIWKPAPPKDTKFNDEASDLKAMMEGVKSKTQVESGVAAPKAAPISDEAPAGQDDHKVDSDLLKEAEKMKAMMNEKDKVAKEKKDKASLAKVDEKTEEARAARYFAAHGMGKVGKMLGETMNKAEAKREEEKKLKPSVMLHNALKLDHEEQEQKASGAMDIDEAMDDDEDPAAKAWKAKVDALKRSHLRGV